MAASILPPLEDGDLGTDVQITDDLAPVWGVASGKTNLAMALYRRLTTSRGGLFYDKDYGYNVTDLLNSEYTPADLPSARGAIIGECEKDERVQSSTASLTVGLQGKSVDIALVIETAIGPFDLVLRATAVTVEILRLAGEGVVPPPSRPDAVTVQVQGPQGLPGPAGTSLGGGGTGLGIFDESAEKSVVSTTEEVVFQDSMDFGLLGASITMQLTAMLLSQSGTSTFRLRFGGTDGAADGTLVATVTRGSNTYAMASASATRANPNGLQLVKVTAQNPVLSLAARIKDMTITIT